MGFVHPDVSAIPVHRLAGRRLHLGPFGSGRDLVKFLGVVAVGAAVASVSSAFVWLPFLGLGVLVSFVRVEGRTLDDFALGYCRFRWRTSHVPAGLVGGSPALPRRSGGADEPRNSIRAGGIPVSYLPPADLERLFEEWRSTLSALGRPVGVRMRGERFSPVPFLPVPASGRDGEPAASGAYRQFVRVLLRHRFRRVVELTVGEESPERGPRAIGLSAQLSELTSALERLGIPVEAS